MRFLAIDYGSKRIGLAIGDSETKLASPLATVEARGDAQGDVQRVLDRAKGYDVDAFVVGLPLNMDDSEGRQSAITRKFGQALASAAARPVHYWDERLSSAAADELLRAGEWTRAKRRARQDRIAAQVLLQEFLDAQKADSAEP